MNHNNQTNMSDKQILVLKLTLFTICLGLLSACSSKNTSGSSSLASRSTSTVQDKKMAACNESTSTTGTLNTRLAVYTEFSQINYAYTQVKISKLPSDFNSSQKFIKFYRWQANPAGSIYLDQTPLVLKVINPANGQVLKSNFTALQWSDFTAAASSMSISDPADFFNRVVIIADLKDPSALFDVVMTVMYDSSGASVDSVNTLIPLFAANPESYMDENGQTRHQSLQNLHPFKDKLGQGWTDKDYETWALQFCSGFSF